MNEAAQPQSVLERPQGIQDTHIHTVWWHKHASPMSILLVGALLIAAAFGVFGGQPHPVRTIRTSEASIELQFPEILRNGEFFEMRATITARQRFQNMKIAIDATYWRNLTLNTMVPGPSEETSQNGKYVFSYGPIKSGQAVTLKFDGQINPPMFAGTRGHFTLMDEEKTISVIPVALRVYP